MKHIKKFFIIISTLLSFYLILHHPRVKQFVTYKVIEHFNKTSNFHISYKNCVIPNFQNVIFSDIIVKNKQDNKELLKIHELRLDYNPISFFRKQIHFTDISLDNLILFIDKNRSIFQFTVTTQQTEFSLFNFFLIQIDNINLTNCAVFIENANLTKDHQNLNISNINSHIQNLNIFRGNTIAEIKQLSAKYDDFSLNDLNCIFHYSNDNIEGEKIYFNSNYGQFKGDIKLYNISEKDNFHYNVDLHDVIAVTKKFPLLEKLNKNIKLTCKIIGNINNNTLKKCNLIYRKNNISLVGELKNCTDLNKIKYEIKKINGYVDLPSLNGIIEKKIIDKIPFTTSKFNGTLTGIAQQGQCTLNLKSDIGNINSNLHFDNIFSNTPTLEGTVNLATVNLLKWGVKNIVSQHEIKLSKEENRLINKISNINYNGVNIENINCKVEGIRKKLSGFLNIDDKNFKTKLDFNKYEDTVYCLGHCDLKNINTLFQYEKKIDIANDINLKFKTHSNDIIAIFTDNIIGCGNTKINLQNLKTTIEQDKNDFRLNLFSDLLDIKIQNIPNDVENVKNALLNLWKNLNSYVNKEKIPNSINDDFQIPFFINLKNDKIFSLVKNEIHCNNINIYGEFLHTDKKKLLNINIDKIQNLKFDNQQLNNAECYLTIGFNDQTKTPIFNLLCEIDKVIFNNLYFDNIFAKIGSHEDKLKLDLSLQNDDFYTVSNLEAHFKDGQIILDLSDKNNFTKFNKWVLVNTGDISIGNKHIAVKNLTFTKNDMHLIGDFNLDRDMSDWEHKFLLTIKNVSLKNYKKYINNDINGVINGEIKKDDDPFLDIDLRLDDLQIKNADIGDVTFKTQYNIKNKIYEYAFFLKKKDSAKNNFTLNGFFNNNNKKIKAQCFFNNFNLQVAELFSTPVCDKLSGFIDGNLVIFGTVDDPKFWGDMDLTEGEVIFTHLKSEYKTKAHFKGDLDGIRIMDLELKDNQNGVGFFNGRIKINFKSMPLLDLTGKLNKVLILDTKEQDNPNFYGHIFCSGDVHFSGPVNFLTIKGNVKNEEESSFFLNINNGNVDNNDFIHFVDKNKQNEKIKNTLVDNNDNGIRLELHTILDKNLTTFINFASSDLNLQGNGDLYFITTFNDDLNIKGIFNIEQGEYLFKLENFEGLISKKFHIENNSYVRFLGDYNLTQLNVSAIKKVFLDDNFGNNFVLLKILLEGLLSNFTIKYDIDCNHGKISEDIRNEIKTGDNIENQFMNLLIFKQFQGANTQYGNIYDKKFSIRQKINKKNKIKISVDNINSLNKMKYGMKYTYDNRFTILKKQKNLNKHFQIDDLLQDFGIEYLIRDNVKFFSNLGKSNNVHLGFQFNY